MGNYAVTRIYHLLNDPDIEFVCSNVSEKKMEKSIWQIYFSHNGTLS